MCRFRGMFMKFLIVLVSLLALTGCLEDDEVSREELEKRFATLGLCYEPNEDFECGWIEVYDRFGGDSVFMTAGSAINNIDQIIMTERLLWSGDRLCQENGGRGIRELYSRTSQAYSFDISSARRFSDSGFRDSVANLAAEQSDDTCFGYSWANDQQTVMTQTTYIEGQAQPTTERVIFLSLANGGAMLYPVD